MARSMIRSRRREVVAHRRELPAADLTMLGGVAVTTPARTWVDLAGRLGLPALVAAGDSVLRAGTTEVELEHVVSRNAARRGVRRARAALPLLDARSRSRPESHLRVAISAPDLPSFQVNEAVYRREGGWLAEPDLSLGDARLALEYQGRDHAEPDRMRKDITRAVDLRREGWTCLYFGPAEVFGRPWQIAPEVRAILRRNCPGLLRGPRSRRRVVD